MHNRMIMAALAVTLIRLILRVVFVIMTESEFAVPLICASLLCIAFLIILQRKGGCSPVILYVMVEVVGMTIFYCLVLYGLDTNKICRELGDNYCEDVDFSTASQSDYTRRPEAYWIVLIIPGMIFDIFFIYVFRHPVQGANGGSSQV